MNRLVAVLMLNIAFTVVGCDAPSDAPAGGTAAVPAPPGPPPPPPGPGGSAAPPVAAAPKAPIAELQPYWGKNYIVMVFARDAGDQGLQQARADWQAHATDLGQQPIVFVQLLGSILPSDNQPLSGQIDGGPAISGQSATDLWDTMGPSPNVTSAVVVGKDGKVLHDKLRGGALEIAAALEPL